MRSIQYRDDASKASPEVVGSANESLMIVVPELTDELLNPLFALSKPIDVSLLTTRDTVIDGGRKLRDHIKQLQDINKNVDVRVTEESFPAFTIVDREHVYCFSSDSRRIAEDTPESLREAADSLWARSTPLESVHHEGESATTVT